MASGFVLRIPKQVSGLTFCTDLQPTERSHLKMPRHQFLHDFLSRNSVPEQEIGYFSFKAQQFVLKACAGVFVCCF